MIEKHAAKKTVDNTAYRDLQATFKRPAIFDQEHQIT